MKLDEGEAIVDVQICTEKDDVLLTASERPVHPLRGAATCACSQGRTSMRRARHRARRRATRSSRCRSCAMSRPPPTSARPICKRANAVRRGGEEAERGQDEADAEEAAGAIELGEKRYVEMSAAEQFVLTVSEKGYGKRTSSYEYRITGRGGKGIVAMAILEGKKGAKKIREKTGRLVASFPVEETDQIMLVTDGGQADPHRGSTASASPAARRKGVIVFDTAEDERVVSVERLV